MRRFRAFCLGFFIISVLLISCSHTGSTGFKIPLSDWMEESNHFTFYLASDSTFFPDHFGRIRVEPIYNSDTVYYGHLQWGLIGDTTEDIEFHVVKDLDKHGNDIFYFDANNDEDLTNDGPPLTWTKDPADSTSEYVEFNHTMPDGFHLKAHIVKYGSAYDKDLSKQIGRSALVYAMITFSAKRGVWHLDKDTFDIEVFTQNASGRFLKENYEWFIIDANHNDEFEFIPPDVRVLLSDTAFSFAGKQWRSQVDSLGYFLTISAIVDISGGKEKTGDTLSRALLTNDSKSKEKAEDFHVFDLENQVLDLKSLRGQVVVLNFWFTGCIPCRKELPSLNRLVERYQGKPVTFAAFTFDDRKLVTRFLKEFTFKYRIVPNAPDVVSSYRVSGFPTQVVIDKEGFIVFRGIGASENIDQQLGARIDSLLQK